MKNNYIIFYLILSFSILTYGQNQNNHWILGTSDLNFSTNPPSVNTVQNTGNYGDAVVSDSSGNLLFYTDGTKVWNKNHQIMHNGEFIGVDYSFIPAWIQAQPVVIIPYPNDPQKYYLITTENSIVMAQNPGRSGQSYMVYSVDFSDLSFPLGKVSQERYSLTEDGDYTYRPITYISNAANDGYFLMVQFSRSILTYPITAAGIQTPLEYILPNSLEWYGSSFDGEFQSNTSAIMKFSPNGLKLGQLRITHSRHTNPPSITNNSSSKFFTLDFDDATGILSNFNIDEESPYSIGATTGFEFSADSQKVYLLRDNAYIKDLSNLQATTRKLSNNINSSDFPASLNHIQRDKTGNILISSNGNNYVHKIMNQDSFSLASISTNFITLNNAFSDIHVLPQLIPVLNQSCPMTQTVTANLNYGIGNEQASESIVASNTIESNANARYHGGSMVLLKNGFHAKNGSYFRGYIEGCTGIFEGRTSEAREGREISSSNRNPDKLKVYPNPTTQFATVSFKDKMISSITLNDVYGNQILYKKLLDVKEYCIDATKFDNGFYIITIQTSDGELFSQKLLKK